MFPFWIDASLESLPQVFMLLSGAVMFFFALLTGTRSGA